MGVHGRRGGGAIAGDDGIHDGFVLKKRLGRPARHECQAELMGGSPVAQVLDQVARNDVAADLS
jgi:hypothetical protein